MSQQCVHGRMDCLCGRPQKDRIDFERELAQRDARIAELEMKLAERDAFILQNPPGYSLDCIKKAFRKTFHLAGELWFNYLGSDEENEISTQQRWDEFKENLGL